MFRQIALTAVCASGLAAAPVFAQETSFNKPSADYLKTFSKPGERMFVYERYDANGKLYSRDVKPLTAPVKVETATLRKINGVDYRLRGLTACPNKTVSYQTEEWNCEKAAADSQSMIYNERASVVLCKTLKLTSEAGTPDPVSCFALVGDGTSNNPYGVSYDDDDIVFLGFAAINKNDKGQSMRPDLEQSRQLGETLGMKDAR